MSQSQGRLPGHRPGEPGPPVPPTPPSVPPSVPPGRRGGRWAWIAGLTALGLITVGSIVMGDEEGTPGDKPSGAPSVVPTPLPKDAMERRWRTAAVPLGDGDPNGELSLWAGESTVTNVTMGGVRGYDIATGKQKWVAKPPKAGYSPCASSPRVNDSGVGAVMYRRTVDGDAGPCPVVAAIDTDTGEVLWWKDLVKRGGRHATDVRVTIGARTLTVDLDTSRPVHRFSAVDGTELAELRAPEGGECTDPDMEHTAVSVVSYTVCNGEGTEGRLTLYDTESGRVRWSSPVKSPRPLAVSGVVADEPLTIREGVSWSLRTYSAQGELEHTISLKIAEEGGSGISTQDGFLVGGSVLVAPLVSDGRPSKQGYAAYDLTTGKRLWQRSMPTHTQLIGVEGDHVLAAIPRDGTLDQLDLSQIGLRDGEVSREGVIPVVRSGDSDSGGLPSTAYAFAWDEGMLYVAAKTMTDPVKTDVIAYRRRT